MPGGYRLEVAPSARSQCNGPKPCNKTKIDKGEFRLGSWVEFKDSGSFKWRHWGCESAFCFLERSPTRQTSDTNRHYREDHRQPQGVV